MTEFSIEYQRLPKVELCCICISNMESISFSVTSTLKSFSGHLFEMTLKHSGWGFFCFFLDDWWFWASSKIILVACVPFMCTTEYLTHTKGLVLQKTLYCKRKEFGRLGKPALKRKTAVFHWKELMFFLKRVMLPKKNMNVSRRVWGYICIAQISYPSSLQAISHSILKEDPAMILLWLEAESTGITAFV